jgi:hypothetical protein
MKLGTKQKAYGLVLGLAATGFVVDRLFFTPAETAAANVPVARPVPAAGGSAPDPAPTTAAPGGAEAAPAGWLAERLRAAGAAPSDKDLRDVFAVPASWRPVKAVVAATPAARPARAQLLGEQFRHDHHLIAVLIEGRNGRAVVDGQLVPVGGAIAGFRLVSVTQHSAQFTYGDEHVVLAMTDSDAGAVR